MDIALGGHSEEDPEDPFWLIPPVVDLPRYPGPLSQQRLEDLQLFGFLAAVASAGGEHPLEVRVPPSDPPDRVLIGRERMWAVELTELTLADVRAELGPMRGFGRTLQVALEASGEHEHLRGRIVNVSPSAGAAPRR